VSQAHLHNANGRARGVNSEQGQQHRVEDFSPASGRSA